MPTRSGAALAALKPRSSVVRLAYATGVAAVLILAVIVGWEVWGRQMGASRTPSVLLAEFAGVNPAGAADDAGRRTPATQAVMQMVPVTSLPGEEGHPALSPDGTQIAFILEPRWRLACVCQRSAPMRRDSARRWAGASHVVARRSVHRNYSPVPGQSRNPKERRAHRSRPRKMERTIWLGTGQTILGLGLDWSPRGTHLVASAKSSLDHPHRLLLVSVASGESHWVTSPPSGTMGDNYPVFAPDGESVAFVRSTSSGSDIYLQNLAGGIRSA